MEKLQNHLLSAATVHSIANSIVSSRWSVHRNVEILMFCRICSSKNMHLCHAHTLVWFLCHLTSFKFLKRDGRKFFYLAYTLDYYQQEITGTFSSILEHRYTFKVSISVKIVFVPFLKGVFSKRKEFAPVGSKFFPFRGDTFQKYKVWESKQEVTKLPPL